MLKNDHISSKNSLIERAHHTLKTVIMTHKELWINTILIFLLGICSTPNKSGFSPFTAVIGTPLLIPHLLVDEPDVRRDTFVRNEYIQGLAKYMAQF